MAYVRSLWIKFIETPTFARRVVSVMSDTAYGELQAALVSNPELGVVIPGSGGLRKVRWSAQGRGERRGVRVIYYWHVAPQEIDMLLVYAKNEQDKLTPNQLNRLRALVCAD